MTLQTSGPISLANIQTEFGGSNPISLSEYYGAASGVPTSGAISLANFYGKSAPVSTLTFIDYTSTRSSSCAFPAGTQAGDIVIACCGYGQSFSGYQGSVVAQAPTGFTVVSTTNGNYYTGGKAELYSNHKNTFSYRVVTAGETAATGMTSLTRNILATYRPNVPITSVTHGSYSTASSRTIAAAPGPAIYYGHVMDADGTSLSITMPGANFNYQSTATVSYVRLAAISQNAGSALAVSANPTAATGVFASGYLYIV
jgi:hypothetical protein